VGSCRVHELEEWNREKEKEKHKHKKDKPDKANKKSKEPDSPIAVGVLLILQQYKVNPALLVVGSAVLGVFSFMPK
jgi:hypothetical protein